MSHSFLERVRNAVRSSFLLSFAVWAISLSILANAQQGTVVLKGHIPRSIAKARSVQRLNPGERIHLALALPLRNHAELDDLLKRLYDRHDPLFGQYLTPKEFTARFGPTEKDYALVANFAKANGLTIVGTTPNRVLLDVAATVATVEHVFGVRLMRYQMPDGSVVRAPDVEPRIPVSLLGHLSGIVGLSDAKWRAQHRMRKLNVGGPLQPGGVLGPFGGYFTPSQIKTAYNLNGLSVNGAGQTLAVFELDGYTASDITHYESYFGLPDVPLQNVLVDGIDGNPGSGAVEVTLDIELQVALAPGVSRIMVYEGVNDGAGIVDTYNRIATDDVAQQISTSWGIFEYGVDSSITDSEYAAFQQMAAQGQSIYAASGDLGAYGATDSLDPATQPFVVGVGGTSLTTNGVGGSYKSETTWNNAAVPAGAGGGGVSSVWTIPSYQVGVISSASKGSTTHRNVPDVSLNADPHTGYVIYFNGNWYAVAGTSAAAPLWAAFNALVNQQRLAKGNNLLGFPNPALYALGQSSSYTTNFHDIADGSTNLYYSGNGYYPAVTGYDDATGWGSFNGANLLSALAGWSNATLPLPYSIVPLISAYAGGISPSTYASAINNEGQVAGATRLAQWTATYWRYGVYNSDGSLFWDTFSGSNRYSFGYGISASGKIVGQFNDGSQNSTFSWDRYHSTYFDMGGSPDSLANSINDIWGVVGATGVHYDTNNNLTSSTAFVHANPNSQIGPNDSLFTGLSAAESMNNKGQIIGFGQLPANGLVHALLWNPNGTGLSGSQGWNYTDLGTLGGSSSVGYGINDLGQSVGYAQLTGDIGYHAFLWTPGGSHGPPANPQMQDIVPPVPTLENSIAYSVNNFGQVVGTYGSVPWNRAFIWDSVNQMQDLNDLLPAASGWLLTSATGINDKGQIVCNGTNPALGNGTYAVILSPPAGLYSLTVSPSAVSGGTTVTGTVTLTSLAPNGGITVTLSSDTPSVASVPATVTVPAGQSSVNFSITTNQTQTTQTANITATLNATVTAALTVRAPAVTSVSLNPTRVTGGAASTATVTLSDPAPTGGFAVNLSSSASAATVPATVTVGVGQTTATFKVTTVQVRTDTPVTITATANSTSASATLTVIASAPTKLVLSPTSVTGGASSTGTVTISLPAPTGGFVVNLSSNTSVAQVPATVTVAAGQTMATFKVTTVQVSTDTPATITATANGVSVSATLTVKAPAPTKLTLNPTSVTGGASSTCTLTLSLPAPTGGFVVNLSSSNTSAAMVPGSVTVAAGQTTATFTVSTTGGATDTTATITAAANSVSVSANLTIKRLVPTSVTLNPTTVTGGVSSTGTVTISNPAPTGGAVISLSCSASAATVPATVTVAVGKTTATFTVTTTQVSTTTATTITATTNGVSVSATLTVKAPAPTKLTLNPTSVTGGATSTGTLTLSLPAPTGGFVVNLSSSNTSTATVPTTVTVAAGQTTATVTVTTVQVSADTSAIITATANNAAASATLTIKRMVPVSVTLAPTTVTGGVSSTGTVTISNPAPTGGAVITLSSSASAATVPGSVTVAAGKTTATFTVSTVPVATDTSSTITATANSVSASATLTVKAAVLQGLAFSPTIVKGGASVNLTATLNGAAPTGGAVVNLVSSNPARVPLPASVTIPAGASSVTISITTATVTSNTTVTATATYGATSKTATVILIH